MLRQDDRVGIEVVDRLGQHFGKGLNSIVTYDPDIGLAEEIARFTSLIIVDAARWEGSEPYRMLPVQAAPRVEPVLFYDPLCNVGFVDGHVSLVRLGPYGPGDTSVNTKEYVLDPDYGD